MYDILIFRSKYSNKNNTQHNQTNMIDNNTGHQGVAMPTTETLTTRSAEYIDLQPHKDDSTYQVLNKETEHKDQPSYDYIDTIDYTFRPEPITNASYKINDVNHHSVDMNQQKSVSRKQVTVGTAKEQIPTYFELDPTQTCFNQTQGQISIPNDNEASYAILDPNETGFDRSNKTDESTPQGTYTILDPSVTGFNRSNDTNNYQVAQDVNDNEAKKTQETTQSVDHDDQSDGEYNAMNEKQQTNENGIYNHAVDNVYDISSHTKKTINTVGKTYDHV